MRRSRSLLALAFMVSTTALPKARGDERVAADQELGARVGVNLNLAGIGAGGFYVAGSWLYRLTDILWFDGRAGFSFGGGGATCTFVAPHCDSALTNGFGVDVLAGVRYFVPSRGPLVPWFGGGLGLGIADFTGDELTGVGVPLWVAGGARIRVSESIALGAEADVGFGPMHYGKNVGWEGFLDLKFLVGIDFAL